MFGFSAKPDVSALEARIEKLERRLKDVESEWNSFYDKGQRLLWRLVRREKMVAQPPEEETEVPRNGHDRAIDPISAQILARRRGHGVLPSGR